MSNSIIDQQQDNETFFFVHHSWLPGPVKPYDHEAEHKRRQEIGAKLVYNEKPIEQLMEEIQNLLKPINLSKNTNPFYWTEKPANQ